MEEWRTIGVRVEARAAYSTRESRNVCFLIDTFVLRRKLTPPHQSLPHNTKTQQRTNFKGAKLMGARFYKSALNEADFTGTSLLYLPVPLIFQLFD